MTDGRAREIIQREARMLAAKLRPQLKWVDNYHLPSSMDGVHARYGVVSFIGMKVAREVASSRAGDSVSVPRPSHYLLIGVLRGNAPPEAIAQWPLILHATALELGAPEGQIVETRNDTQEGKPRVLPAHFRSQQPECVTLSWPVEG